MNKSNLARQIISILMLLPSLEGTSISAEIASCRNLKGSSYFHYSGLAAKNQTGWQNDAITGGLTTLQRLEDGKYDIVIVDVRNKIISLRQDGGDVLLVRRGATDATFLHLNPGMTIEIYTFWTDRDGYHKFDLLQSKGGDGMLIHKSSVMIGDCDPINFELMK
jgi:hypothetical protein